MKKLMVLAALFSWGTGATPAAATSPGDDDEATVRNYGQVALLGLEVVLGSVFLPPQVSDLWSSLPPGEVRRLVIPVAAAGSGGAAEVARDQIIWVWKEGPDLIAAIDESHRDGDGVSVPSRPDSIEDCFVIDYESDGLIDRVVDWVDLDADGRADQQVLYALPRSEGAGSPLTCFLIEQRDADRGFWQLDRWQYDQRTCQFRSDFSGDQFFTWAYYREDEGRWVSRIENPFCFYDPDGDGLTEEALQFSGEGSDLQTVRWSFDSDDDASALRPHDYDFSVNAVGRVRVPPSVLDTLLVRGNGEIPLLRWDAARAWAVSARWQNVLLAVDENDENVDPGDPEKRERWEGVIASPARGFPALGGPDCGVLNKRYEAELNGGSRPDGTERAERLALYLSEIDGRIHLHGASTGWIDIDEDLDGVRDARLQMEDRNGNGYFDTWLWDGNGDGEFETIEEFGELDEASVRPVALDFASVREAERVIESRRGGRSQRDRYWDDVKTWREHGRFVTDYLDR